MPSYELEVFSRNVPDEEFVSDLRRCAVQIGKDSLTMEEYGQFGKYHPSTLINRFGSWHSALKLAALGAGKARSHAPDADLFANLAAMWESLGRQPRSAEVRKPFSTYAVNTYSRRFGTWQRALAAFVDYVESQDVDSDPTPREEPPGTIPESRKRRTRRNVSERQRFRVLLRDGFSCTSCGASPLKSREVELHVDHVVPWSEGGETEVENLAAKCSRCNLGKGNLIEESGSGGTA